MYLADFNFECMKMNRIIAIILLLLIFWSCRNNDDDVIGGAESVAPRSLTEVAAENDVEIQEFLRTHFYNYEEFQNPPADFDFKIILDTIANDNADKIPLIDQVESDQVDVSAFEFNIEGEENISHTYYYLNARQGLGNNPSVADSTFVRYRGSLLNRTTFDASDFSAVWFDLPRLQTPLQGFRGFTEVMTKFKSGGDIIVGDDGTFTVDGYGVGMMIFPSGLGGFNRLQSNIPAYSPLIFTVDLFQVNPSDHDNDGIPSILEDTDENGLIFDDNTDLDALANYFDADDDNDGTPTRDEIELDEDGNFVSFKDTDGDGTPDHLDTDN